MSDSLWSHGLQLARLPCPSQSPGVCSNSCPLSEWCHPTISSSVIPFFYCLQYFPATGFLQDLLELTPPPKKRCPFHHRGLECKGRKSRDTWSNRQVWPWGTKWSRTKNNRVLPREYADQQKLSSNNTRDDCTHEYNQIVNTKIRSIIFFLAEDGEALYSQEKQDQKLTVTQIMNFLL